MRSNPQAPEPPLDHAAPERLARSSSSKSPTVEIAGDVMNRKQVVREIRRHAKGVVEGEEKRGQAVVADTAGCDQTTVSRRLADGGKLAQDHLGRRIESAILQHVPPGALAKATLQHVAPKQQSGATGQSNAPGQQSTTPQSNQQGSAAQGSADDDAQDNESDGAEDGATKVRADDPDALIQRIRRPILDVREAIRSGDIDSVCGPRKALLVSEVFGTLAAAGYAPSEALGAAWYTAVAAKEPADSRLHVVEPFVSEFGFDPEPPKVADEKLEAPWGGYLHPVVPLLTALLDSGLNVWLYGEAGYGKSRAVRDAARLLGREYYGFACHKHTHTEDALGGKELENGDTSDRLGPWPTAMERGAILALEEPSKANAGMLAAAHSMLEEGELMIPTAQDENGDPVVVRAQDGFAVAACDNAEAGRDPGRYAAVEYMDPAFLDRFVMIEVGELPDSVEVALMRERLTTALRRAEDSDDSAEACHTIRQEEHDDSASAAGMEGFIDG